MPIQIQLGEKSKPLDPAAEREKRRSARFWTGVACIVCVLAFVMVLRLYAFEATLVVSGSMEPTLYKGDYALFDHRVALRQHWNRGDVVVFDAPLSWSDGGAEGSEEGGSFEDQILVKRVIGLPGETVAIRDGVVAINDQPLDQSYVKEPPEKLSAWPFRLGPDQYFVMGDNRNNSDDSRNNGPISEKDIKGRVLFKLWPPSHFGSLPSVDFGKTATDN